MKKLISYTVFKSAFDINIYAIGAISNALDIHTIYPEYTAVFYLQDGLYELGKVLQKLGAIVHFCPAERYFLPLLWRNYPLFDMDFDICLFRDTDSRLSIREKRLVDLFLDSKYLCHSIKDHEKHLRPLMAGMWGVKRVDKAVFDGLRTAISTTSSSSESRYRNTKNFIDEIMLQVEVWPHFSDMALVHDSTIDDTMFEFGETIGAKCYDIRPMFDKGLVSKKILDELDNIQMC